LLLGRLKQHKKTLDDTSRLVEEGDMVCQNCGSTEQAVQITRVEDGEKVTASLCASCAVQLGFHSPFDNQPMPLDKLINALFEAPELPMPESEPGPVCPNCYTSYDEFAREGRLGCGACYSAFRDKLVPLMERLHGKSDHLGRTPKTIGKDGVTMREEERITAELQAAIEREDYEAAAELRDKLTAYTA
jgi:protein arginine kinase activator